jgi:hypothetical protein
MQEVELNDQSKKLFSEEHTDFDLWGLLFIVDLHECDAETIRDPEKNKQFVVELCDMIRIKPFGEALVLDLGEDENDTGNSVTILIETSLNSTHFPNQTNSEYLVVFNRKLYVPDVVTNFAKLFFKAKRASLQLVRRH